MFKRNIEAQCCNDWYCKKARIITYSECVFVVPVIQHAKHMRLIFSVVSCLILYLINGTIFGSSLLNIQCALWLSLQICLKTSYSKNKSARYYHKCQYVGVHARYLLLSDFNENWIFWTIFEIPEVWNLMKICPVRVELFISDKRKDGQTAYMAKLTLAFAILLTRLKICYQNKEHPDIICYFIISLLTSWEQSTSTTARNSHQSCVCVVPPEDGQVMPETCRDFEPQ
jgi:hypothetical protein